jgi:hypothetical protein
MRDTATSPSWFNACGLMQWLVPRRSPLHTLNAMEGDPIIDTAFDVRTHARGRGPDSHSRTLRRYHQLPWSKPLPNSAAFDLDAGLHHHSDLGDSGSAATPGRSPATRRRPSATLAAQRVPTWCPRCRHKWTGSAAANQPTPRHSPSNPRSVRPHPGMYPAPLSGPGEPTHRVSRELPRLLRPARVTPSLVSSPWIRR